MVDGIHSDDMKKEEHEEAMNIVKSSKFPNLCIFQFDHPLEDFVLQVLQSKISLVTQVKQIYTICLKCFRRYQ